MKLALFDSYRLGVVIDDEFVVDVTAALPEHSADRITAGWWRGLCRDFAELRPAIETSTAEGARIPLADVTLRAPALNPSKVIAAASNYHAHVEEMHDVQRRTLGKVDAWMMDFDVFLKAPSSISDPGTDIVLPASVRAAKHEIHHESELVIVIGTGGSHIPVESALDHVLGYTAGLDITVRSDGDRSRRKSYDTFSPLGPWITVADDGFDPADLHILLTVSGAVRQDVNTNDLIVDVPGIVSYASSVMTLEPGDIIFTGAPPGVGPIEPGDELDSFISGIGHLRANVREEEPRA
jgi:2-keto-4-pentenoate hydratase/2-oxohepta-3-ene-1,7-dioic acid hydratase in catechol pathway